MKIFAVIEYYMGEKYITLFSSLELAEKFRQEEYPEYSEYNEEFKFYTNPNAYGSLFISTYELDSKMYLRD